MVQRTRGQGFFPLGFERDPGMIYFSSETSSEASFMKLKPIIAVLIAVTLLWGCAPKIVYEKVSPDEHLFSKAEKMFQAKKYERALDKFNDFLARFPYSPQADAAVMNTGFIYTALGEKTKALNAYERLLIEYPESPLVPDAKIQILLIYYDQGEFIKVIDQATGFLAETDSIAHIFKTYLLLGDTYLAVGIPTDAVGYYDKALKISEIPEKETIIPKLKEAIRQLESGGIEFLLSRTTDKITTGYLMYQIGLNNADEEKYEEALNILSELIDKFPDHEIIKEVENLLAEIKKKSVYSRYTIGCLLPLSGSYKTYGNRALKGVELALNRFSAQNTHPSIKIVIKDTGSDPVRAVLAVMELLNENVAAIIGPIITAEPAAMEAQKRGVPILTLTQKGNISKIGDYVFRNFFTPAMQVKTLVSFAVEELGLKTFAILYPEENYGRTFMNLFWDEVIAYGGSVVGVESYHSEHTDFADPIKKLVGLYYELPDDLKDVTTSLRSTPALAKDSPTPIIDFDAIFIPDAPKKAGLIIPQLAFYDVDDIYLLGTNLWHSESLIKMTRRYIQDAILTDGFFAESASEHVAEFVRNFQEVFGQKPEFIEAVAYDSAMELFKLVSRPDVRFRSTLKNKLKTLTDFQGVTALTSFDSEGDIQKNLYLLQIKGDRFVERGRLREVP